MSRILRRFLPRPVRRRRSSSLSCCLRPGKHVRSPGAGIGRRRKRKRRPGCATKRSCRSSPHCGTSSSGPGEATPEQPPSTRSRRNPKMLEPRPRGGVKVARRLERQCLAVGARPQRRWARRLSCRAGTTAGSGVGLRWSRLRRLPMAGALRPYSPWYEANATTNPLGERARRFAAAEDQTRATGQVFIDGFYAVSSMTSTGSSSGLHAQAGPHHIESARRPTRHSCSTWRFAPTRRSSTKGELKEFSECTLNFYERPRRIHQ